MYVYRWNLFAVSVEAVKIWASSGARDDYDARVEGRLLARSTCSHALQLAKAKTNLYDQ